jgi:hypothetical protein
MRRVRLHIEPGGGAEGILQAALGGVGDVHFSQAPALAPTGWGWAWSVGWSPCKAGHAWPLSGTPSTVASLFSE